MVRSNDYVNGHVTLTLRPKRSKSRSHAHIKSVISDIRSYIRHYVKKFKQEDIDIDNLKDMLELYFDFTVVSIRISWID